VIDKDARTRRLQASFPCAQRAAWRLRAGFFLHSPGPFRFRVLQQSLSNSASRGPAGSVRLASLLTSIARQFFVRVRSGFVAPLVVLLLLQPRAGRPVVCVRARLPNLWFRARPLIWRVTHPTHASSSWLVPGCESDRSSIEAYPTYLLTYCACYVASGLVLTVKELVVLGLIDVPLPWTPAWIILHMLPLTVPPATDARGGIASIKPAINNRVIDRCRLALDQ
jgi:hypothetical protein